MLEKIGAGAGQFVGGSGSNELWGEEYQKDVPTFEGGVMQSAVEREEKISSIKTIDGSEAINYARNSEGIIVKDRDDLKKIIEAPCLEACLDLYDKNIQTINSSANAREIGHKAYIGINYDSLSEENKRVLSSLIKEGMIETFELSDNPEQTNGRTFPVRVPVYADDNVGVVSDRFMQIVSRFLPQDVLYGRYDKIQLLSDLASHHEDLFIDDENDKSTHAFTYEYAIKKLSQLYGIDSTDDFFESLYGYKYDEELDIYWQNQELYNKHRRYQETKD